MTTLLWHGIAVGLLLSLACGDSGKQSATGGKPTAGSKASAHAAAPADLCSLLTEAEAEAILGKPMAPPQRQTGGDCWYMKEGGTNFGDVEVVLSVLPVRMQSEREFDAFVAEQVKDLNASMKKAGVSMTFTAERVGEVDAPAYYVDPSLLVLRGSRVLGIAAPGRRRWR